MLIESTKTELKESDEHVVGNMDSKCCGGFSFKPKFHEHLKRNLNHPKPLNFKRASCSSIPINKPPLNAPPIIISEETSNIDSNSILHRNCEQLSFSKKPVTIETAKSNVNLVQNFNSSNINLRKINNNTISPLSPQPSNHKNMYNRFSGSVQNLPQKLNSSFRKKSASEMNLSKPLNTTMVNNVEYVNYCPSVLFSRMRKSISTQNLRQPSNQNQTASGSSKNWKQYFKFGGVKKKTKKDVR